MDKISFNEKTSLENNVHLTSKIKNVNTKTYENENHNNLLKKETDILKNDLSLNKFRETDNDQVINMLNAELSEERHLNSEEAMINDKFMLEDKNLEINVNNLLMNKQDLKMHLETNEKVINNVSTELNEKTQYLHEKQYEISRLKQVISSSNIEIDDLRKQLDDQRNYTSLIVESKTLEVNSLVKNINETNAQHNNIVKTKESEQRDTINRLENNKDDLIKKHNDVISDLKNTIFNQREQIAIQKMENENSELNLNNIKFEKQNDLNNKF